MEALRKATLRAAVAATTWGQGRRRDPERGDIPGWVMITIMTAGLVTLIWSVAQTQLVDLFRKALDSVVKPN